MQIGVTTLPEIVAYDGGDYEQKAGRAEARARRARRGQAGSPDYRDARRTGAGAAWRSAWRITRTAATIRLTIKRRRRRRDRPSPRPGGARGSTRGYRMAVKNPPRRSRTCSPTRYTRTLRGNLYQAIANQLQRLGYRRSEEMVPASRAPTGSTIPAGTPTT